MVRRAGVSVLQGPGAGIKLEVITRTRCALVRTCVVKQIRLDEGIEPDLLIR
jgi:hypothetical protein